MLSREELKKGIIILWCPKCGKPTKHQTLNRHKQPIRKRGTVVRAGKTSGPIRYYRRCMECGHITKF